MVTAPATELLEREAELAALDSALAAAAEGQGGTSSIEGPAGIGKTSLLEAPRAQAAAARLPGPRRRAGRSSSATCRSASRGSCWSRACAPPRPSGARAAARRRRRALRAARARRGARARRSRRRRRHRAGATRSTGCSPSLAEDAPLLLAVDDAHWADQGSLDLARLPRPAPRTTSPLLASIATRPPQAGLARGLLDRRSRGRRGCARSRCRRRRWGRRGGAQVAGRVDERSSARAGR